MSEVAGEAGGGGYRPGKEKEAADAPGRLAPSILERHDGTCPSVGGLWDVQIDDELNRERRDGEQAPSVLSVDVNVEALPEDAGLTASSRDRPYPDIRPVDLDAN